MAAAEAKDHYLKAELYELVRTDPSIFEFLQDAALDGLWYWDLEEPEHEWLSPQFWRVLGYDPATKRHLASEWQDLIEPDDLAPTLQNLERHLADPDHPYDQVVRYRHLDGSTVWVRCRGLAVRDADGKARRLLGAHTEVTALKKAELELAELTGELRGRVAARTEQLAVAEDKYRKLFDEAPMGIFQSSPEGRILTANPMMAALLGYGSPRELIDTVADLAKEHYADPEVRQRFLQTATEVGLVTDFEVRLRRTDGSVFWALANTRAVLDESGEVALYEGTITDVTRRKALEEQLRQSQRLEAVGRLAGSIAHDFNNLLTAVLTNAGFLLTDLVEEDPAREHAAEIIDAGRRAAALTRQLLAFGRRQILQPKVLSVNDTVEAMRPMLRRLVPESIRLVTSLDPDVGLTKIDPIQLEQVILNLAINARDAMPRGGSMTIETENVELDAAYARSHVGAQPGPHVMLAVSDTGVGMDETTRARVFEPFFTTKAAAQGSGLGLATVYGIVKQTGGNVWVYSEQNGGSSFKVYLPRSYGDAAVDDTPRPAALPGGGTETVLIVEDEALVRLAAARALRRYGYTVLEAELPSVASGIIRGYEEPIDLLITDVVMPEMSGVELAALAAEQRPAMKVLYISGYAEDAIVEHGVLRAGLSFLGKPFTAESLARRVREVLEGTGAE